ncbi:MAG: hypothetical protein Q4B71_01415 [Cardiobacteriaceae bacterium]|nr:hypothetical protein [Cardiobacteriaceae bacterium]
MKTDEEREELRAGFRFMVKCTSQVCDIDHLVNEQEFDDLYNKNISGKQFFELYPHLIELIDNL